MFGKKLKIAMINAGLSQEDFAKLIDTNRTLISQWITGFRNPSVKNLKKISKVLKVPINYFFEEDLKNTEEHKENSKMDFMEEKNKRLETEVDLLKTKIELLKKDNEIFKTEIKNLKTKFQNFNKK